MPPRAGYGATMLIVLALIGCAYDIDKFQEDYAVSVCTWLSECDLLEAAEYGDQAACEADVTATVDPDGCDLDKDAARTCIDDIEALGCGQELGDTRCLELCE